MMAILGNQLALVILRYVSLPDNYREHVEAGKSSVQHHGKHVEACILLTGGSEGVCYTYL